MLYILSKELTGHEGCARCVCVLKDNRIVTGGLDNQIIIWNYVENAWIQELHLLHHKSYVLALEPSDILLNEESHEILFYSGGLDKIIYRLSAKDGKILATYKGHKSTICSIKEHCELNILISGSWDGSAIIWDLTSSECKHTLNGHQHAVTVSIISQPISGKFFLLTGSQNKSLFLWKIPEAKLIKTIKNSHDDIIRSISISNNIFEKDSVVAITVSNDCAIKIWQLFLKSGSENCILKNTKKHHKSFIFDVKFSKFHTERFFTASDDCSVAIWKLSNNFEVILLQNITMTSTIWNITEMKDKDSILTVSEDGTCRIWINSLVDDLELEKLTDSKKIDTTESHKCANSEDLQNNQEYNTNILNEVPEISQLNSIIAEKIGTVQIFKDTSKLKAYEWANCCWNYLGTITEINNLSSKVKYLGDKYFDSGLYDLVIKIEIDIVCNNNKVPFNFGNSVIELTEKFCLREGIDRKYCKAISNSIINGIHIVENATTFSELFESCFEFKLFKKFNIDSLIISFGKEQKAYLDQLNTKDRINLDNTSYLLDAEIEHLNDFFIKLKSKICNETNSFTSFQIKYIEMEIIYKKLSNFIGNNSLSVPIIDLWRILALHPQSSDIHKKTDQGWWLLALILNVVDLISIDYLNYPSISGNNEFRGSLFLICIRFLCNMFHNSTNREAMLSKIQSIILKIDKSTTRFTERNFQLSLKENTNKNSIVACLAFMFNYIVALNNKNCAFVDSRNLIILYVCKFFPLTRCGEFAEYVDEILHYQLLILTNNYYYLIKLESYSHIYIPEDKEIRTISNLILKCSRSSKTLYYQLVTSLNIIKNGRN
ncbi:unnamed protein product [Cryptosporidium hominis]|uniref:PLAA/Doa1/Lub1/WD40/PUL domain containing protein n=1 Tax=Cryptosporidium hominis TaxID=237895 RepID=A0A0S4TE42_CRYHO|nr:At3g18860/MCB22_3 [Cryptosporidium hominis TU502]OLQ15811.1 WD domain G-beta repeat [Cryptosporidium hominis]PPA64294.1 WD domain G-beta repeat family protein [Cryptosporidium hominis]PPS96337.1 PLAA/Doa1/Lub1/WD40/PUL domain containing protein [Cryptosporidium hominis]CUV05629.1 unnamed protein product [Cryptosporidium hominis]|eukprot:PPS96337.1 PLAA/Doa1/Lub1/WD40/PUL domain containing protein [Cryptosporidium hominis]